MMDDVSEKRAKKLMDLINCFIINEYKPYNDILSLDQILFQFMDENHWCTSKQSISDICFILTNMKKYSHLLDKSIKHVDYEGGYHGSLRYV